MRVPLSSFVCVKFSESRLRSFHRRTFSREIVLYAKIAGSGHTRRKGQVLVAAHVASCSKARQGRFPRPGYLFRHLPESVTETDTRLVSSDDPRAIGDIRFHPCVPWPRRSRRLRPGISGDDNLRE